jgi:hypothetical protein
MLPQWVMFEFLDCLEKDSFTGVAQPLALVKEYKEATCFF